MPRIRSGRLISVGTRAVPVAANNLADARVFYALRVPMGSKYSGPLVRVRRSTDNTESDIYASLSIDHLGNRFIDTVALLSFCAGGSGYVAKWYSQGDAGFDAVQATAANQPRIVNAGSIETANGKPAITWTTTSTEGLKAPIPFATYPCTIFAAVTVLTAAATRGMLVLYGDDNGSGIGVGNTNNAENFGTNLLGLKGGVAWMPTNSTCTVGVTKIVSAIVLSGGAASSIFADGAASVISAGASSNPTTPSGSIWIGLHPRPGASLQQAKISEVGCYSGIQATRLSIERNIGAAYGIQTA